MKAIGWKVKRIAWLWATAVMMMTLTATTAMAQGSGNNDGEITGQETPQYIGDAVALINAGLNESGNEGILYVLTADIEITDGSFISKCLKLDLNGHTIIIRRVIFFSLQNNATLTIVDRSTGETKGSVISLGDYVNANIQTSSGAKFIARGVSITCANGSAISNSDGTVEITGCTVSGRIGIYNFGTTTVTGCSISGTETAIYNMDGTLSINTGENSPACTISGGKDGIYVINGTVTLNAWPTFCAGSSAGVSDITLYTGQKITIGTAITAAPAKKISIRVTDFNDNDLKVADLPYTITSGYASNVTDGSSNVLDPADVFTYYKNAPYIAVAPGGDNNSEAALIYDPTNASVTFAFAEGQEWMTWCSDASFTKPDGIEAYAIESATPTEIIVTPIVALGTNQTPVLPDYTPLLLHKKESGSLTAQLDEVPDEPLSGYNGRKGIMTQSVTGANVYGATKQVTSTEADYSYVAGRTYMLKSGAFVAVDANEGFAANRCWITLNAPNAARRLEIRRGDATDVKEVKPAKEANDNTWYTLTGTKLEKRPDRKGIYLNGGKKIIIK